MDNGIWIEEWAKSLGITEPVNGTWIEAIRQHYGGEDVNGTHLMTILNQMGGDISNGTMIEGIMNAMGRSIRNGSIPAGIGNSGDITIPPTPPVGCTDIQDVISNNYGNYGTTALYYMIYKLYNYNRTGWILLNEELGTEELQIRGIEFEYRKLSSGTVSFDNQKLYLGHIQENAFPSLVNLDLSNLKP